MNPLAAVPLQDVQALPDHRDLAIDEVGIDALRYPVLVLGRDGEAQRTVATVAMDVDLAADVKGTHMSRFIEVLDASADEISPVTIGRAAAALHNRLGGTRARIDLRFPYFREQAAPVSGLKSYAELEGRLIAETTAGATTTTVGVNVPVTSLCPCSKEISDYGAHNQRGYIELTVACAPKAALWLEDLVEVADRSGSAPIYPLLKRVDERYVTMAAYDNPVFVEDIAREAAAALREDARVVKFEVAVTNQESIHNHNAVARLRWERKP